MNKTCLFVIGGFLGSGKTTSILSIAKYLAAAGKKVGIVTNDQGCDLVDTNFLANSGLAVLEVTGGCFCCNFNEFTNKVNELSESLKPDIILAEPVGSCTDLIATIFKPMAADYTKQFAPGPLSIVVDPKRVRKLMMEGSSPFPSEINYLFRKQLEEADIIVLNKIDMLSKEQIKSIVSFLKEKYKGVEIISISAKEGTGVGEWVSLISGMIPSSKPSLDIDYETYAKAEEYLGWLNGSALITSDMPHDGNNFINQLMESIKNQLTECNIEIAHLKIYEISGQDFAKASLTGNFDNIDFNRKMEGPVSSASLIINARVNTSPDILEKTVKSCLKLACFKEAIKIEGLHIDCFKPGRPAPTHRLL